MYIIKKLNGLHTVLAGTVAQFKSTSRQAARNWRDVNQPLPIEHVLNVSVGKQVWSNRP